jgi:Protein of unknown function (DUF3052)
MAKTAGYSGTPLAKKLGIKDGMRLAALNAPKEYVSWLNGLPPTASVMSEVAKDAVAVHVFATERQKLARALLRLRTTIDQDGFVWVSWPKKTSGVVTDITEDVIREVALPLGFVDVKVCAVTETWSGLKLVIRKTERRLVPPRAKRAEPGRSLRD